MKKLLLFSITCLMILAISCSKDSPVNGNDALAKNSKTAMPAPIAKPECIGCTNPPPPPPPPPGDPVPPPTQAEYYGMGFKTGFNLVINSHVSSGQNTTLQYSITNAGVNGQLDYRDGLVDGGIAADAKLLGPPVHQVGIFDFVVDFPQTYVAFFTFHVLDGSYVTLNRYIR